MWMVGHFLSLPFGLKLCFRYVATDVNWNFSVILPPCHCVIVFLIIRYIHTLLDEFQVQGVEWVPLGLYTLEEVKSGVAQVAVGWLPTN